jgi:hypothetical protein
MSPVATVGSDCRFQRSVGSRNLTTSRHQARGKAVLDAFYRTHLHRTGLPKVVFTFETARHARRRRAVVSFFDVFFGRLTQAPLSPTGHSAALVLELKLGDQEFAPVRKSTWHSSVTGNALITLAALP